MQKWMRGFHGAVLIVLLWVIGWGLGFGGIMEILDPDGKIQDVWPTVLAIPGLIGGIMFSGAFLVAERARSFAEVPLIRCLLWGAASGLVIGLLTIPAKVGDISPGAAGMIAIGVGLGTVAGLGTGVFFRLFLKWAVNAA